MKGEFDEQLKWPFSGSIIVTLVDQVEDKRHCTRVIQFDDQTPEPMRNRVTEGAINFMGYGFHNFVPHSELQPLYLKDNCLKFRIIRVEFNK